MTAAEPFPPPWPEVVILLPPETWPRFAHSFLFPDHGKSSRREVFPPNRAQPGRTAGLARSLGARHAAAFL
jgi:hypothetical protein